MRCRRTAGRRYAWRSPAPRRFNPGRSAAGGCQCGEGYGSVRRDRVEASAGAGAITPAVRAARSADWNGLSKAASAWRRPLSVRKTDPALFTGSEVGQRVVERHRARCCDCRSGARRPTAHRWRGTDTGRASMLRQTAFSLSAPRRYLGRGTRRKLRAEAGTVIRRGLEGSGAGTAKRRNGAGGCAARRRAHHGASAGFMASRTPCEGLPGPARACTGTGSVRSVRSCQRKRLKATGCGGLRVVQGRCPWSRLTRDNCRYRESNCQFSVFARQPDSRCDYYPAAREAPDLHATC